MPNIFDIIKNFMFKSVENYVENFSKYCMKLF